jgi:Concanavalin A-like lectin/glucanases superfamily
VAALVINGSDTASPVQTVITGPAATAGTWTHLVAAYNAATGTASLYVNGSLAGTAAVPAAFNASGPFAIGRALSGGTPAAFWAGSLSDVQTWAYALTPDQVTALYQQIN